MTWYRHTDAITGIEIIAAQQEDRTCIVTLAVPAYDTTDDLQALRVQARGMARPGGVGCDEPDRCIADQSRTGY